MTLVTFLCLAGSGLIPCLAVGGAGLSSIFLAPLLGAVLASFALMSELLLGGSLGPWFVAWVLAVNSGAAVVVWRRRKHTFAPSRRASSWRWNLVAFVIIVGAVTYPLTAMVDPLVGYDAHAIWILHSMFAYGGHQQLIADLRNPAYRFSNPDYPPLVPSVGALGFSLAARLDYRVALQTTALLNGAALALLASGVVAVARPSSRTITRWFALLGGGGLCLVGFGIAGQYAVDGYADLLWAAAAAAAIVYGLVLPRERGYVAVATIAATVAALTKNEGFVAAVIILVLVAVRNRPGSTVQIRSAGEGGGDGKVVPTGNRATPWLHWGLRLVLVIAPSAAWPLTARILGIGNTFFGSSSSGSHLSRFDTTARWLTHELYIVPAALALALVGGLAARSARSKLRIANPLWLWIGLAAWLVFLVWTYTFGVLSIQWWLSTSADRTTIFPQLVLCAEIIVWSAISLERVPSSRIIRTRS